MSVTVTGPDLERGLMMPGSALVGLDQVRIVRDGRIEEVTIEVLDRWDGDVFVAPFALLALIFNKICLKKSSKVWGRPGPKND